MAVLSLAPALSALTAFTRLSPSQPLHTFFRSTAYKLSPPRPLAHLPAVTRARDAVLASGRAEPRQLAAILCEQRNGPVPTIVLGGFMPESTEQVYLLRGFMLRRGSVYYVNYAREGFSLDLFCAQLDDLVEELNAHHGLRPVVFAVSFGCGLLLEWMRRARLAGREPELAGSVIVSPVACVEDILTPNTPKATTLLGRALKPFVDAGTRIDGAGVEKARAIFSKMFEAGAQNKSSLRALLTGGELKHLRDRVLGAVRTIDPVGAFERVQALRQMPPLSAWVSSDHLPLSEAPALILFAENESAVIVDGSPTRRALDSSLRVFFPRGERLVIGDGPSPVQHASLIFHYFQFLPPIAAFYRGLKPRKFPLAA